MHTQTKEYKNDLLTPLLASQKKTTLQELSSLLCEIIKLAWEIIKTTPNFILSYDFSMMLIAFGFILSRIGEELAAPDLITSLNMYGFVSFMAAYPAAPHLGQAFGEISAKQQKENLLKKMLQEIDISQDSINEKETRIAELRAEQKEEPNDQIPTRFNTTLQTELNKLNAETRQQIQTTSRIPRNAFYASLAYNIPLIISMLFIKEILIALGQSEEIAESVQKFFDYYLFGFVATAVRAPFEFVLLFNNKENITRSIALTSLICVTGCEIPASIYFGLPGLATAAAGGLTVTALGFGTYIATAQDFRPYSFLKDFINHREEDYKKIWSFVQQGFPTVLATISDIAVPLAIAITVNNTLGDEALEKQNKIVLASAINTVICAAIAQITQRGFSQKKGELKEHKADELAYLQLQRQVYSGISANFGIQLLLAVFVCATPSTFITMMGSSAENDDDIRYLLILNFLYMITENSSDIALYDHRALGNNFWPSLVSSVFSWLGIAVIYLVNEFADLDILHIPLIMFGAALCSTTYMLATLPAALRAAHESDAAQANKITVIDDNDEDSDDEAEEEVPEKNADNKTEAGNNYDAHEENVNEEKEEATALIKSPRRPSYPPDIHQEAAVREAAAAEASADIAKTASFDTLSPAAGSGKHVQQPR